MKKTLLFLFASIFALLFANCKNKDDDYIDPRGTDYAGSESCIQCHKGIHESTLKSSHFKATAAPTDQSVLGNFAPGHNVFSYDKNTKITMEKRNGNYYHVLYKNDKEFRAYPVDIVFGTKNAQTSVYFRGGETYELPVSYYRSIDNWATSPRYSSTVPNFDRLVERDCYACHVSNVSSRILTQSSQQKNFATVEIDDAINKKTIVHGIDCERCHGPAKEHVTYHEKFPNARTAHAIVSFKSLSRQQKFDACAICHSGSDGFKLKSRFDFKPGDNLSDFYRNRIIPGRSNFDVHGNQAGLLSQSQCFIKSETMTCVTCHNPHENASKNPAFYSAICMSCHNGVNHSASAAKGMSKDAFKINCISCHMPKESSIAIRFQASNSAPFSSYQLRTHKIAIYPDSIAHN
jgi:hypothetical protein